MGYLGPSWNAHNTSSDVQWPSNLHVLRPTHALHDHLYPAQDSIETLHVILLSFRNLPRPHRVLRIEAWVISSEAAAMLFSPTTAANLSLTFCPISFLMTPL